jgi:hypothetical protein
MKRKLSRRAGLLGLVAGLLLVALIGWFALVAPQRSKASSLQQEIQDTELQIQSLQLAPRGATHVKIKVADLFRLSKAIPTQLQMPDILLELNRVAGESGITFGSIAPHAPTVAANYQVVPIDVVFRGNYYDLNDFLFRLRNLVEVHKGQLQSTGRLFTVDHLAFGQGEKQFPLVEATLTINAFIYGGGAVPDASAAGSTSTSPSTSASTTTASTPGPAPPSGATAAGVKP